MNYIDPKKKNCEYKENKWLLHNLSSFIKKGSFYVEIIIRKIELLYWFDSKQ